MSLLAMQFQDLRDIPRFLRYSKPPGTCPKYYRVSIESTITKLVLEECFYSIKKIDKESGAKYITCDFNNTIGSNIKHLCISLEQFNQQWGWFLPYKGGEFVFF